MRQDVDIIECKSGKFVDTDSKRGKWGQGVDVIDCKGGKAMSRLHVTLDRAVDLHSQAA